MSLNDKFDLYLKLFKEKQDLNGFILTDKCDSLLFSCLAGCVEGIEVNVAAAQRSGQWFRRPLEYTTQVNLGEIVSSGYPECYECGGSKSTISRDQLLGLAWYAWCNKRLDISEGVIKYALAHFGIMGKGVISRTFIGFGILSTFAWISYRLGGPSRYWLRILSADLGITAGVVGFAAHLQVLHVHLRSEITGNQRDRELAIKIAHVHALRTEHNNTYFNYVANVIGSLLQYNELFPEDRLPTEMDRVSGWLWERDPGLDWQPTEDNTEHTGGDFLWAAAWDLGKIKGGSNV